LAFSGEHTISSGFANQTSLTLLARLRHSPADQDAWAEFVRRYGPQVCRWCRRWQLQEADADEVTQLVLVRLSNRMRTFQYDPSQSFRAYLRTVARYAWCDFLESSNRPDVGRGGSDLLKLLETAEAGTDLVHRLNEAFDEELLEEAQSRVRQHVEPHTWQAFQLTGLQGMSGAEAAKQLGMKIGTVFKAKSKVQQMLREEIGQLEEPCVPASQQGR
jgi:RNA polymerase sigma-70 factor (ECF subfamily)